MGHKLPTIKEPKVKENKYIKDKTHFFAYALESQNI